jgi:hypothetical protein
MCERPILSGIDVSDLSIMLPLKAGSVSLVEVNSIHRKSDHDWISRLLDALKGGSIPLRFIRLSE